MSLVIASLNAMTAATNLMTASTDYAIAIAKLMTAIASSAPANKRDTIASAKFTTRLVSYVTVSWHPARSLELHDPGSRLSRAASTSPEIAGMNQRATCVYLAAHIGV
jgi:hypothetical protein